MKITGLKFIGYKSFTEEYAFIDSFPNITVFIGRNNSGKSSCIDMIENLIYPETFARRRQEQNNIKMEIGYLLTDYDINRVFQKGHGGGGIPGRDHYEFGKNYIGKEIYFGVEAEFEWFRGETEVKYKYKRIPNDDVFDKKYYRYWDQLADNHADDFLGYEFRRLGAERNIVAETESSSEEVDSNDGGSCNLVWKFLNYGEYDERLIEEKLVNALNEIIYPDSQFSGIKVQQVKHGKELLWEIFLQEGSRRYALSKMGSGLKTIILALINLLVIPETKGYKSRKIIYAFEELENNLHPALQRRLFDYLYKYSVENGITMFLTTHSHVAINAYCNKENAQIYHITKKDGVSSLHKIDDYIAKTSLLDDLDVRASDLLQANGIIWVEGPSDRVYMKRWLEIFGGGELKEGRDYQIVYYGGRLLAHYSADDEQKELMNVLITNRNAAIVMDSDKRSKYSHINDTKKRVKEEVEQHQAFCWITQGKEIENYIPYLAIEQAVHKTLGRQCGQYELFSEYMKQVYPHFSSEKVLFAHAVCPYISMEDSSGILDLKRQMEKLIETIRKWNPQYKLSY